MNFRNGFDRGEISRTCHKHPIRFARNLRLSVTLPHDREQARACLKRLPTRASSKAIRRGNSGSSTQRPQPPGARRRGAIDLPRNFLDARNVRVVVVSHDESISL
jgi:hypothetical protein